MKIKMLVGAVFAGGVRAPVQSYPQGAEAEVTQAVAAVLVGAGLAEPIEEPEPEPEPETRPTRRAK